MPFEGLTPTSPYNPLLYFWSVSSHIKLSYVCEDIKVIKDDSRDLGLPVLHVLCLTYEPYPCEMLNYQRSQCEGLGVSKCFVGETKSQVIVQPIFSDNICSIFLQQPTDLNP